MITESRPVLSVSKSQIGRAVERRAKRSGFPVIRNLCGHGVGRFIHEDPQVPNTFHRDDRTLLREGLVTTIEPIQPIRSQLDSIEAAFVAAFLLPRPRTLI